MKKALPLVALLPLVVAGCLPESDPSVATSPLSSTTTSTTPAIAPVTESEDIVGARTQAPEASYEGDFQGIDSYDDAALATLASKGVSCPSDQQCLAAIQSACALLEMGYTSDDVYSEMYFFPNERVLPDFPNSAVPHFLGVAKGGYCDNY